MDPNQEEKLKKVWRQMRRRCESPKDPKYYRYGARGIQVCEEWQTWENFLDWATEAGYGPGLSIDRRDVDGPYEPDNCRWSDRFEQANNTTGNVYVTAFGETKTISQWSRDHRCQCTLAALGDRIRRRGWDPAKAITTPNIRTNGMSSRKYPWRKTG